MSSGRRSTDRRRLPRCDNRGTMDVQTAIRTQRAIRRFSDEPLSEADVEAILNAGRRAQSSKNTQPWRFVVVRDRDTLRRLSECGR
jgi:nitroreductase